MKVVFHEKYKEAYTSDPAAAPGRMEAIASALQGLYEFVEPKPATDNDVLLIHTINHLNYVKSLTRVYEVALLAVGGALKAAEIAFEGEPAFALIRPPGHHASPNECWGFCYFNNVAIAVEKLMRTGKAKRAVIVDFDLHFGDGTNEAFKNRRDVEYHHLPALDFTSDLERFLEAKDFDVIAVSAGFDRALEDWGGLMSARDYEEVGKVIREFSQRKCDGRRFAVLEGGYNHEVLGRNVKAFLEGFK
ncbi:MAG: histone deacetylase family protein [Thermoprotei archaeon]|nr:MAG: histone deacetylase family protein [Thermoprotei archaeon]RLF18762.1 MAG: histone deacetylase family protein [Thermoprotei archaeon]